MLCFLKQRSLMSEKTIDFLTSIKKLTGVTCYVCAILYLNNTSQAYDQRLLDMLKPGGFYFLGGM